MPPSALELYPRKYPGPHLHPSGELTFEVNTLCLGQLAHAPYIWFGNSPSGQEKQAVPPAGVVNPTGHLLHSALDVAPNLVEKLPCWQAWQRLELARPIAEEYVPGVHWAHLDAACISEYWPAEQLPHRLDWLYGAKVPGAQSVQFMAARPLLNRPGGHALHAVAAAAAEKVPAWHAMHVVWPATGEDVPAVHTEHAVAPDSLENCPALQLVQASVSSVMNTPFIAPPTANFPAAHPMQVLALFCVAYVPAAHPEHVNHCMSAAQSLRLPPVQTHWSKELPATDVDSGGHARQPGPSDPVYVFSGQAVHADAPAGEFSPVAQRRHVSPDVAAAMGEKYPSAQGWHRLGSPAPVMVENVPGRQSSQAVDSWYAHRPVGQRLHCVAPASRAKVPAWQTVQVLAPHNARCPAGHVWQVDAFSLAKVPALHGRHRSDPGVSPNVPAGQSRHELAAPMEYSPAWQSRQAEASAGAHCPGPHSMHVLELVSLENSPGWHAVHVLATSSANSPAGHAMQDVAERPE